MCSSSLHFDRSTGQQLPANVSQPGFSQSLQSCLGASAQFQSLARCGQDQEFQVQARAGDVMAGAGGAAGPAPDVRYQPPGDGKEES